MYISHYLVVRVTKKVVVKLDTLTQKYSRLRCLLCVKSLVICFYLGWSGTYVVFFSSDKI